MYNHRRYPVEARDPPYDTRVRTELDEVVWRVHAYARQRSGRLAGISLRVPPGSAWDGFAELLSDRLVELGLDAGQVHQTRAGDRVVLVSMEFER